MLLSPISMSGDPAPTPSTSPLSSRSIPRRGQFLDEAQGSDPCNNFANLYSGPQYPSYPWFLRTLGEANELWEHIVSISGGGSPSWATFNVLPKSGGTVVGGAPPLVAFGSQGGGTPLYTNQSYNFGVGGRGQLVFDPITISSINNGTGRSHHGDKSWFARGTNDRHQRR